MRVRAPRKIHTKELSAGDGGRILVIGKQYLVRRGTGHARECG